MIAAIACSRRDETASPAASTGQPAPSATPAPVRSSENTLVWEFADPERRTRLAAAFPRIDALFHERERADKPVAAALAVVVDANVSQLSLAGVQDREGRAPVTQASVFRIASLTKTFTATLILKLRDDGKLALDEPAARLLPELERVRYPTRDSAPISIRQLLTHASGLPKSGPFVPTAPGPSERDVKAALENLELVSVPGVRYLYSNLGFGLLGILAGRASGTSFREALRSKLLGPLGMHATYFDAAEVPKERLARSYSPDGRPFEPELLGALEGDGGLYSSIADMTRYMAFQLSAQPPSNAPDRGPVVRATLREMQAMSSSSSLKLSASKESPAKAETLGAGLGWAVTDNCFEHRVLSHDGAIDGFSSYLVLLPEYGVGLFYVSSSPTDARGIVSSALAELRATGALEPRRLRASPKVRAALTGYLKLYDSFDAAGYRGLFEPEFQRLMSAERVQQELGRARQRFGACTGAPVPVEVTSAVAVRYRIPCDKAAWSVGIRLGSSGERIAAYQWTLDAEPAAPAGTPCRTESKPSPAAR
jgi:CubicO group peptidase (beta-lactamase class C family)